MAGWWLGAQRLRAHWAAGKRGAAPCRQAAPGLALAAGAWKWSIVRWIGEGKHARHSRGILAGIPRMLYQPPTHQAVDCFFAPACAALSARTQ